MKQRQTAHVVFSSDYLRLRLGLPDDWVIGGASFDVSRAELTLTVLSDAFPELPETMIIPPTVRIPAPSEIQEDG